MPLAKAITKYVRISPRKARYAADLARGLSVENATLQLKYCKLRGGRLILKTLDSAVANAEQLYNARRENMIVHEIRVDGGAILRRSQPRSKGSANPIAKRTSHFTVVISTEGK
jgi:large subunit ribosomal protein L22